MSDELQSRFEFDKAGLSWAKFLEYHDANPQVYDLLKRFALEARHRGRLRLSINMLFERARWYTDVETDGDSFKLNNNWRAYYARLLMEQEPGLATFFETRRAGADDVEVTV